MCMPGVGKAHGTLASGCQLLSPPALGRILHWARLQGPHRSCPSRHSTSPSQSLGSQPLWVSPPLLALKPAQPQLWLCQTGPNSRATG